MGSLTRSDGSYRGRCLTVLCSRLFEWLRFDLSGYGPVLIVVYPLSCTVYPLSCAVYPLMLHVYPLSCTVMVATVVYLNWRVML